MGEYLPISYHTALLGVMRYAPSSQDAYTARVSLLKFVPLNDEIRCIILEM
jgi:hypothetical protein